jgi:hypothetical protein
VSHNGDHLGRLGLVWEYQTSVEAANSDKQVRLLRLETGANVIKLFTAVSYKFS